MTPREQLVEKHLVELHLLHAKHCAEFVQFYERRGHDRLAAVYRHKLAELTREHSGQYLPTLS